MSLPSRTHDCHVYCLGPDGVRKARPALGARRVSPSFVDRSKGVWMDTSQGKVEGNQTQLSSTAKTSMRPTSPETSAKSIMKRK